MLEMIVNAIRLSLLFSLLTACSTFQPSALEYSAAEIAGSDKASIEYAVYTPPGWNEQESLPLVLFLHGMGDNHQSFEKRGGAAYFDQQITDGHMPRVILVSPNGDRGFWENWFDGSHKYRDWVMGGVLPEVQSRYNTASCPQHCHLMGISMGGFGAMRFAYHHQQLFSSLSVISGAIFTHEQTEKARELFWLKLVVPFDRIFGPGFQDEYYKGSPFYAWVQEPGLAKTRLQLMVGNEDDEDIKIGNLAFHRKITKHQIDHEYVIFEGRHKWRSWLPNLVHSINFLTAKP